MKRSDIGFLCLRCSGRLRRNWFQHSGRSGFAEDTVFFVCMQNGFSRDHQFTFAINLTSAQL